LHNPVRRIVLHSAVSRIKLIQFGRAHYTNLAEQETSVNESPGRKFPHVIAIHHDAAVLPESHLQKPSTARRSNGYSKHGGLIETPNSRRLVMQGLHHVERWLAEAIVQLAFERKSRILASEKTPHHLQTKES
jgi:hypothetical protein